MFPFPDCPSGSLEGGQVVAYAKSVVEFFSFREHEAEFKTVHSSLKS